MNVFQGVSPQHFREDDRRKYHASLAGLLWQQDRRHEALEHLGIARQLLRQARRVAGIDETTIEYVARRAGFIDQCVRCALDLPRHDDAFAAVQDGKATVLGDLRSRLNGHTDGEPSEVLTARNDLTTCLRRRPLGEAATEEEDEKLLGPWRSELQSRADNYLKLWHRARHPVLGAPAEVTDSDDAPPGRAAIQQHLRPGWAVLDFWRLDDETIHVFALTRDELAVHKLAFPSSNLHRKFDRFFKAIANPLKGNRNDQILDDLNAYLFNPLRNWLRDRGVHGLYLVPHDFLHLLPLHAARCGAGYLFEEFEVAYLPSSALLPQLPPLQPHGPVFSLSNPERGTPHTLHFSEWEGSELHRRYGARGGRFFRGKDAHLDATTAWSEAALVHFSCHGSGHDLFAPLSHLRLADDLLLAHDVLHRRPALREASLVVLNGCQTSVRDGRARDEAMGLMTAFLMRGASLVLATQWSVIDGCAAEVVLSFLEGVLEKNRPPAEALCQAQGWVRRMKLDDLLHRWEDVEKFFADGSPEKGKWYAQKAWLCLQAGRAGAAEHYAGLAQAGLRRAGLDDEADRLLAVTRSSAGAEARSLKLESFDHPVFWGAFQLVGRVV